MSYYRKIDIEQYPEIFKALSNPNRLAIFKQLVSCCCGSVCIPGDQPEGSLSVGKIGEDINVTPSTLSHHLKELSRCGLVNMERCGQQIKCWVDSEIIADLENFFTEMKK